MSYQIGRVDAVTLVVSSCCVSFVMSKRCLEVLLCVVGLRLTTIPKVFVLERPEDNFDCKDNIELWSLLLCAACQEWT